VAYNQQLKRDGVIRNKVENKDEVHFAGKLVAGVKIIKLYIYLIDVGVSRMTLEKVKCSVLKWAKSVETDSILKRILEEQQGKKTRD